MIEVISFESFQEIMVAIRNAERQDTKWRDSFLVPFPLDVWRDHEQGP
jgi:hypothetical protein